MWFWCHQPKKTKPCLEVMTKGAVACPWCGTDKDKVRRGYVPLYRQSDTAPRSIIVSDLYEEVLAKFKLHDRFQIGKEGENGDPVWVARALTPTPAFNTTLRHRYQPVDLTDTLLKLWGNDELKAWYRKTLGNSDNPVSQPKGSAVRANGEPFSPMMQAAAQRQGFETVAPELGTGDPDSEVEREFLRAVMAGNQQPTNGKHKKKKG